MKKIKLPPKNETDNLDALLKNNLRMDSFDFDSLNKSLGGHTADEVFGEIKYTDNPEIDHVEELTTLQKKYRADRKTEADTMKDTFDSEFWCCLVFDSRKQKETFLKETGMIEFGEKYLDGVSIAKRMDIELPPVGELHLYAKKPNKKLNELAMKKGSK